MVTGQIDELVPVFENGRMLKEYTFTEVRNRVKKYLNKA
jgi:hypothetical protein